MSQDAVAEAMRARGFSWRQSTVHAVEKGDRRIQLNEAAAICGIFGDSMLTMIKEPEGWEVQQLAGQVLTATQALQAAVKEAASQREDFILLVSVFSQKWEHVPSTARGLIEAWADLSIEEAIRQDVENTLSEWAVNRSLGFAGGSMMDGEPLPQDHEDARQRLADIEAARRKLLVDMGIADHGEHPEAP